MNNFQLRLFTIATFAALSTSFAPKAHAQLDWIDDNQGEIEAAVKSHDFLYTKTGEKVNVGIAINRRRDLILSLEKNYKLEYHQHNFFARLLTLNKYLSTDGPKSTAEIAEVLFTMNTALAVEKALPGTYTETEVLMVKKNIEIICDYLKLADIHREPFEISPREFAYDPIAAGTRKFKDKYRNLSVEELGGKVRAKHTK
ncbi:MAG TPA: hypothetical protein VM901_02795 [Bdellovibrionota bacterium]|jgi:hypothetical protein|nr:hypothetical protein [Bdellovibrionota bacterium]